MGVDVTGQNSRNNCDPQPARLRFASAQSRCSASAFFAPRTAAEGRLSLATRAHKGEGRLGLEPSRKQTEFAAHAASTSTGQALASRTRNSHTHCSDWARANLIRVWRAQAPKRVLKAYDAAQARKS